MGNVSDPTTYKEVIVSPQSNLWIDAMKDEMTSMSHNKVWSLVNLLDDNRPIGCKWVFKTKRDAKGHVEIYKERLVARVTANEKVLILRKPYLPCPLKTLYA